LFEPPPDVPPTIISEALGVSWDGQVAVGRSPTATSAEAFRWTSAGGMVGLGSLPGSATGSSSEAYAASADGSVVVGYGQGASGSEAFRWTAASGMVGLGDLPGGIFSSSAHAVSDDGSVVAGSSASASGYEALRWTQGGGMVGLGDLPGGRFESEAFGMSADGSVVIGYGTTDSGRESFRWTEATGMVGLGHIVSTVGNWESCRAVATSADGRVVVGTDIAADLQNQAFRWTQEEGVVGLDRGPFDGTGACDCSADASVVVGTGGWLQLIGDDLYWINAAFIWDVEHGSRKLQEVLEQDYGLDLTGWWLISAEGVSADGSTFVGVGWNPNNDREAWIAVIPEPATLALLGLGGLGLVLGRKRK
jgi:probable HAF family extracellular repeat protein